MRNAKLIVATLPLLSLAFAGCGHSPTAADQKAVDDLHKIVSVYIVTQNHLGHPPAGVDDLRTVFTEPSSANDLKLFEDGRYVVVWKTPFDPSNKNLSTTVLAFEKTAYTNGGMVQMLSGVDTPYMTADALKAALKKNPAWNEADLEQEHASPKS